MRRLSSAWCGLLFAVWLCGAKAAAADVPEVMQPAGPTVEDDYTKTRYPLLLVPGAILFDMPVDAWSYWFGIVEALQKGGAEVFVSRLPVGVDSERTHILEDEVNTVLGLSGAAKVNLIGYSQGGQTCRITAAHISDKIASVTTVAAPHKGSGAADRLLSEGRSPSLRALKKHLIRVLDMMAKTMSILPHQDGDFVRALAGLTTAGTAEFNAAYPDGIPRSDCGDGAHVERGVHFFSWGGIGALTNPLDPSDAFFLMSARLIHGPSDGLVGRCSSHFGRVIRDDFHANHFDEINQMMGLSSLRGASPLAMFRSHANRLKRLGL